MKQTLVLSFVILSLIMGSAAARELHAHVERVLDGDTLVLGTGQRVRLLGIDCPEKKQPHGIAAKDALARRVLGKAVTVEWRKRDRYGRIIGKILSAGKDVNLGLVEEGACWWYEKYARNQPRRDRSLYRMAERRAQERKAGLWSHQDPMPPWEWRRKR